MMLHQGVFFLAGLAACLLPAHAIAAAPEVVFDPTGDFQAAPHGAGNAYAPEILFDDGVYRMWYGAQGRDGHDRILLAESPDGVSWKTNGVALDHGSANHVNDPSIVKVGNTFFMYSTRAAVDVRDEIALATSTDGVTWEEQGTVFRPGGTRLATSPDGLEWHDRGLLAGLSGGDIDRFGHVTPFLLVEPDGVTLFAGAARSPTWDRNVIVRVSLTQKDRERFEDQ